MSAIASKITSLKIAYSTVCSGADQRKHLSYASLSFVRGINQWPVNSPHKGPVTRKMLPFDDVIMKSQRFNLLCVLSRMSCCANCGDSDDLRRHNCVLSRLGTVRLWMISVNISRDQLYAINQLLIYVTLNIESNTELYAYSRKTLWSTFLGPSKLADAFILMKICVSELDLHWYK